ncbi:glycosyltransferase family 2 protein [Mycetocola sp. JXN-3]|uniref:glycosyltransferase family 2 protein n=1 Tax=Mycetocola sp. JXN-3 TaxID=2116510 RepID=UPI00165CFB99|nr:glycosyltransferase family 2 protein [Mycetocola sp. JXN-3]
MSEHSSAPSQTTLPGVSYVMPVLNDVTHVRAAVDSLLAQDYTGPFEVAIAVGPSIDGTNELVAELSAEDPRIRVIDNPVGSTPAGLNIAIRATTLPIVVRVDAHSVLPPNYTSVAVETILRTGAANVGGIMDARGTTPFEQAVARAYGSRVGLGGSPHHVGGTQGPAETVYLGVFRRDALEAAGLFDERIKRGQDWELNHRLAKGGETVWFTPEMRVVYRPRPSLNRLIRQFFSTGLWRGELSRTFPSRGIIRYFAPPLMVLAVTVGIILGIIGTVEAALGTPNPLVWGWIIPAGYVLLVLLATLTVGSKDSPRAMAWFLIVIPCIHFCWGIGFILGYLSLAGSTSALKNEGKNRR